MSDDELSALPQLCTIMVHDLKNPLAALVTNLRYLVDLGVAKEGDAKEALSDSVMLCDVLDRYLKNLDLFARGKDAPARKFGASLATIVRDAMTRLGPSVESLGVEVVIALVQGSDLIDVDRDLFGRSVENTIANAAEHAPRGSRVEVTSEGSGGELVLVVRDTRRSVPADPVHEDDSLGEAKRLQARYGRGLSLLAADIAARVAEDRLSLSGSAGAFEQRLAAPRPSGATRA